MPSGSSNSFLKLSRQLITNLQNRANLNKIERILESELVATYGLTIEQALFGEIAKDVCRWYDS